MNKFTLELALSDIIALRDLIAEKYTAEEYYATKEPTLDDDGNAVTDDWTARQTATSIKTRARMNDLCLAVTGETLT